MDPVISYWKWVIFHISYQKWWDILASYVRKYQRVQQFGLFDTEVISFVRFLQSITEHYRNILCLNNLNVSMVQNDWNPKWNGGLPIIKKQYKKHCSQQKLRHKTTHSDKYPLKDYRKFWQISATKPSQQLETNWDHEATQFCHEKNTITSKLQVTELTAFTAMVWPGKKGAM